MPHRRIVHALYLALAFFEREHPGVIDHFGGGAEFQLSVPEMASGRNPDLAVVTCDAPRDPDGQGVPRLAIEVVSPGAEAHEHDHVTKREEYLIFGLDEYWIVDPIERRVLVLMREGVAWAERVFEAGEEAKGRILPGFRVPVADL